MAPPLKLMLLAAAVVMSVLPASSAAGVTWAAASAPSPAASDDAGAAGGEVLNVRLRTVDKTPVAGVTVTVSSGGTEVGTAESDADGLAAFEVPEPGPYTVEVDLSTLPEEFAGLSLAQNPRDTRVDPGTPRNLNLLFEENPGAVRQTSSGWSTLPQLFVSGLRFGLLIALAALGLSMIYGTTGLTNFAHGELITFGAVMTFLFNNTLELPFIVAALLAVALTGAFGWATDAGLWKPLRRRGTGLIAMMIISIGFGILVRYVFAFWRGTETFQYREYAIQAGIDFGPFSLKPADLIGMIIATVVLVLAGLSLIYTRIGKATRAVADNPALAAASGIDVDRVIRVVWVVGGAMAGLAGVLLGINQGVSWNLGAVLLLLIFAAVTLGGLGTAFGAVIGALIVGILIDISTAQIDWGPFNTGIPTELKYVGALVVLIVILLFRPQGILGRSQRVG